MAFFEAAVVDTVYETSEPLGLNSNENDWYQLLALLFDPNRGGGSRGSTCTVSTLDNAMPCHRTGYFKHEIHTPPAVIKIR